jgi:type I phosphodiesterase/nucleotide pyrophosphatase
LPVDVVVWWATAPAEQVLGHVVSDRAYFEELGSRGRPLPSGLVHPPDLGPEVSALIVLPDQVTLADARRFVDVDAAGFEPMRVRHPSPLTGIAHELTYFISTFESTRRIALHVMARSRRRFGRPADLFVLFRIIDKTSHTALHLSTLVDDHVAASPTDLARFGTVVTAAYREADRALGEILAAAGEANVVVLSDHGFHLEGEGAQRGYNHREGPPGILIGHGPSFAKGRVEGVTIYDVFPLLAYLKALPVADDLPGTVPLAALDPGLIVQRPVTRTASYGVELLRATDRGSEGADAEMLERLRALGYIK